MANQNAENTHGLQQRARLRAILAGLCGVIIAATGFAQPAPNAEPAPASAATANKLAGETPALPADQSDRAWTLLQRFTGGEWIHETRRDDGGVFRVRSLLRAGPGERSVFFKGWLGAQNGMFMHSNGQAWRTPDGQVVFQNIDENGSIAAGPITSPQPDMIEWDWKTTTLAGERLQHLVQMTLKGDDTYRAVIFNVEPDGSRQVFVDLEYQRVAVAPAEFRRLRASEPGAGQANSIESALFPARGVPAAMIDKSVTVSADAAAVFAAWTTEAGIRSFLGVPSHVDLRIGGPFEILFGQEAGAPVGEQGSEGCQVLAYIPDQMLCFSWNAPPKFAVERGQRTWVVLTLTPAPDGTTVRLVHTGFGTGGHWAEVRAYFDNAWGYVLGALTDHFQARAAPPDQPIPTPPAGPSRQ